MSDSTPLNYGYCQCGCGQKTKVATYTDRRDGTVKGQPKRFIRGHNRTRQDPHYVAEDRGFETPCWIWQRGITTSGHGQKKVDGKLVLAHRWIYERGHEALSPHIHLHHLCFQPSCVNPDHLQPLTPARHMRTRRTTKLSVEQVLEMRQLYAEGDTSYSKLAKRYGVAVATVQNAINGPAY